jgi:hypothetical protein
LALWREDDPDTFNATIAAAAERLDIQPLAVEKDYWVCEVLRAIVAAYPEQVIFKGGTSLEKLRITRRAVPPGGFATSIAFDPLGEFADHLRREHDTAMGVFYYGTDTPPSFDEVLDRVHSSARLLRCGA